MALGLLGTGVNYQQQAQADLTNVSQREEQINEEKAQAQAAKKNAKYSTAGTFAGLGYQVGPSAYKASGLGSSGSSATGITEATPSYEAMQQGSGVAAYDAANGIGAAGAESAGTGAATSTLGSSAGTAAATGALTDAGTTAAATGLAAGGSAAGGAAAGVGAGVAGAAAADTAATAGVSAGAGAAAGAEGGSWAGPIGAVIGAGVGLLASQLF